ncbi:TonB-dependent receptor [Sphingomonas sp. PP-CC-3G-468]|uniref:TonB-dependent receptor n=1 Tax=Sphingomonas sp. PP-CC-3G-468 TaxID=2135656 RepID=UPI001046EA3B|nr:TonB-dependent receptor [Sphingomonas sp. PP-CC-3G-468]TCM07425.1 TonB-dependent receptor-like protein [Sphingomonas sp. PP-CC-3G-468]
MRKVSSRLHTIGCMTAVWLAFAGSGAAWAQQAPVEATPAADAAENPADGQDGARKDEIVVTGSRIRRSVDETASAPVAVLDADNFKQRGFNQAGDALNELTSNTPQRNPQPYVSNGQAVAGADFPNLFNLGPARTLTLVNGRRTVSTSLGLGDEAVDTNIIPLGLLDRIEVVQGGGAAVYGSGAIGGVVNYVLKKNAQGVRLEAQNTVSGDGDYSLHTARLTAGRNFAGGRGNIAIEADYSKTSPLVFNQRSDRSISGVGLNLTPGAGANGIPFTTAYNDATQYVDQNGLVVTGPFNYDVNGVLKQGGRGITINGSGDIELKGLGTPVPGVATSATGSELRWPFKDYGTLVPGVERAIGSLVGHYDITNNLTFSTELLVARTRSQLVKRASLLQQYIPVLSFAYPDLQPLPFTRNNPYLSQSTVQALSAANPAFAAGQPLYLSKNFLDADPNGGDHYFTTTTYRALAALNGNFSLGKRRFDYEVSYSHGQVDTDIDAYAPIFPNIRNAANAVRNSAGQIVCAINQTTVVDAACVPFNIFGTERPNQAALNYIVGKSGVTDSGTLGPVKNLQDDVLATVSGDIVRLPGGMAKFSATYEHRDQRASFNPLQGDLDGIYLAGIKAVGGRGGFNTDEIAGEVAVPLVGGDFRLPLVEALDFDGSYRLVNSTLAGNNSVWGVGGRWLVGAGFTARINRSRNFRAPSINQVSAPGSVTISGAGNPCSITAINGGPNPTARRANCEALFTANPNFGLNTLPAGTAATVANRLANFVGTGTSQVQLTTRGNPELQNETSDALTFGFVFQPTFLRGLTITADRLDLKIGNALALFGVNEFASTCFDQQPQQDQYCSTIGFDRNGDINRGVATTVNAGSARLKSDLYNIDYRFALSSIASSLPGQLALTASATHNRLEEVVYLGVTQKLDGTVALPEWSVHFETRYKVGPALITYAVNYLSSSLTGQGATVENSTDGFYKVRANYRHDLSLEYTIADKYAFRFGVNDLFDRKNEYPVASFGDILGRRFFAGVTAQF